MAGPGDLPMLTANISQPNLIHSMEAVAAVLDKHSGQYLYLPAVLMAQLCYLCTIILATRQLKNKCRLC